MGKWKIFCVAATLLLFQMPVLYGADGGGGDPFVWSAERATGGGLSVRVKIAPHHYLYANRVSVSATGDDGLPLVPAGQPAIAAHTDPVEGKVAVYGPGTQTWSYLGAAPYLVNVTYQGCRDAVGDDSAMCFAPAAVEFTVGGTPARTAPPAVPGTPGAAAVGAVIPADFTVARSAGGLLDESRFLTFLRGGATPGDSPAGAFPTLGAVTLLLIFLGGFALNFTPCVLPLIPINLAIIGAGAGGRAGFRRGLAYGAGMALAYGALGGAVVFGGARFGELNSSAAFNWVVAGIFLVLAGAMFGFYNVDFARFRTRFHLKAGSGGMAAAAVMGVLSALLAGACVAPVVLGVLVLAAKLHAEGSPVVAALLPLALGIGMALPWPFAGAGVAALPRPGRWMNAVKAVFGLLLVGAAVYYGAMGWSLRRGAWSENAEFARLAAGFSDARIAGKPLLVDFWATWCGNCAAMERDIFPREAVRAALADFIVVKFQAEKPDTPRVRALLDTLKIPGLPAFVIFRRNPPSL